MLFLGQKTTKKCPHHNEHYEKLIRLSQPQESPHEGLFKVSPDQLAHDRMSSPNWKLLTCTLASTMGETSLIAGNRILNEKLQRAAHQVEHLQTRLHEMNSLLAQEQAWKRNELDRQSRGKRGVVIQTLPCHQQDQATDPPLFTTPSHVAVQTNWANEEARRRRRWRKIQERVIEKESCQDTLEYDADASISLTSDTDQTETIPSFVPPRHRQPLVASIAIPLFSANTLPSQPFPHSNNNYYGFTGQVDSQQQGNQPGKPSIPSRYQWYSDLLTTQTLLAQQQQQAQATEEEKMQDKVYKSWFYENEKRVYSMFAMEDQTGWLYDQKKSRIGFEYKRMLLAA